MADTPRDVPAQAQCSALAPSLRQQEVSEELHAERKLNY
jgi:hypothetical protein